MKGLFACALLAATAATVAGAPQLMDRDEGDDDCSMVWVTIYMDASSVASTSSTISKTTTDYREEIKANNKIALAPGVLTTAETTPTPSSHQSSTQKDPLPSTTAGTSLSPGSASNDSSALDIPNRPDGSAPIPINNDHLSAPVATDAVPAGAAVYTPSTPGVFNNTDFAAWMKKQKDDNLASKWMKVAAGTYRYALGAVMPSGTDANTIVGQNIAIGFMPGGWTLDLREVTFFIDVTPANKNRRPDDILYSM